jgi:hypothetical protein
LKNKNGTAEVIGTVLFLVILIFFFSNVYLWHDAATKQMDDLFVQKINSPITISIMDNSNLMNNYYPSLNVTNRGGMDATLSVLWVDVEPANNAVSYHGYYNLTQLNKVISAGSSILVYWSSAETFSSAGVVYNPQPGDNVVLKMITTVGNSASCSYTVPLN